MARAGARSFCSAAFLLAIGLASGRALAQEGDISEDGKDSESSGASEDYGPEDSEPRQGTAQGGGIHFGLRLGFAFPFGKTAASTATNDNRLSDLVNGQLPIWIDVGWQASPSFMLGAYLSYGFTLLDKQVRDSCDARRQKCSAGDLRIGIQAQYSFSPGHAVDPWLGLGGGYEWLNSRADSDSGQLRGWEFLFLQGGLDFNGDTSNIVFGPFVAFSFAQFQKTKSQKGAVERSDDIPDKAIHNWLFIGVRGALR